jgi:tetratricopeptide (TPR) repeat protein
VLSLLAGRLGLRPEELSGEIGADFGEQVLLAEAALGLGRPADAVALLDAAVGTVTERRLLIDPMAFRACQVYATALERNASLVEAVAVLERLRDAAESAPGRLPWLPVMIALVRCYRDAGDLGRAVDLGESALRRYRDLRLEGLDGHAALTSTLASVYSERGDHLRAKTLLDALIERAEGGDSLDDRAYAYWNSSINAAQRGHVGEGLRLADRAAGLLAEGGDARSQARLQVTRAWLLLAEQPPDAAGARRLLRAVLPEIRQHAGALSVASAETELARCELLLGRADVARRLAKSALKRLGPTHRMERARALTALGAALVAAGDTAAGIAELEEAAEALRNVESQRQAAAVWRQLAALFRSMDDSARALDAADRALDAAGIADEPVVNADTKASSAQHRSRRPSRRRVAST